MKKSTHTIITSLLGMLFSMNISSQTVWDGEMITFTKPPGADWNLPENQDRITDDIRITRGNYMSIFNIADEDYEAFGSSPADTRWAFGTIADGVENLIFDTWGPTVKWSPPDMVDQNMVLFLVTDSIYIDIRFTSWTSGQEAGGGGFSYERSTGEVTENLWTGPVTTFTKANDADWNQSENQDRITDNVWITRADVQGIFNIAREELFNGGGFGTIGGGSPRETEWAFGTIADGVENLNFDIWGNTVAWVPPDMVDQDMVLHIIPDDIYIDIRFNSWTTGQVGGGGFSYTRSTGTPSESLWTGESVTFTKADFADWTLEENQDRITDNVWITRADSMGIFNIAGEESFRGIYISSPTGTKWAFGTTADGIETLRFDYFLETIFRSPLDMVNQDMVLQLVEHDIYIDIKFTSWSAGPDGGGGGFSYMRSTGPATSAEEESASRGEVSCYPNPARASFFVKGLEPGTPGILELYDIAGKRVLERTLTGNEEVGINHLDEGIYLYRIRQDAQWHQGRLLKQGD